MTKEEYYDKLKDPRWQKKRLKILERDNFSCQACGDDASTLHIHHRYYTKNTDPWDYSDKVLITLCQYCHEVESEAMKTVLTSISNTLRKYYLSAHLEALNSALSGIARKSDKEMYHILYINILSDSTFKRKCVKLWGEHMANG